MRIYIDKPTAQLVAGVGFKAPLREITQSHLIATFYDVYFVENGDIVALADAATGIIAVRREFDEGEVVRTNGWTYRLDEDLNPCYRFNVSFNTDELIEYFDGEPGNTLSMNFLFEIQWNENGQRSVIPPTRIKIFNRVIQDDGGDIAELPGLGELAMMDLVDLDLKEMAHLDIAEAIANDLTTNDAERALSAAQGVALKTQLDGIEDDIEALNAEGALQADGSVAGTARQELLQLNLSDSTELTIATGAVTITRGVHRIDTESNAASDDLDTISGGQEGDLLFLYGENAGRVPTLRHGTGNIRTFDGQNIALSAFRAVLLYRDTTNWFVLTGASYSEVFIVPLGTEDGEITTGKKATLRAPWACTMTVVRGSITTAQTSGDILTMDVRASGTTMLSSLITLDNNEKTSLTAAAQPAISDTTLSADEEVSFWVTQCGSGGAGPKVTVFLTRTA